MSIQQMFFSTGSILSSDGIVRNSADFLYNTTSGNTYTFLGASSTTYSIDVLNDASGKKAIRFPVTYPGTSFVSNNQDQITSFTPLSTSNYNILNDIFYIFGGGYIGVSGVYGVSETAFDFYSISFNSYQIFRVSGTVNNVYYSIYGFKPASLVNSGQVRFQTDGSVNGGSGLYFSSFGGNAYFYFSP
jgi:hypothetical protein